MSKSAQRGRLSRKPPKPHKGKEATAEKKQRMAKLAVLAVVLVLAGIPFLMGKYFELNSPGAFDSGAYAYSAAHILSGAKIGAEEVPSAQLGTLLINMLGVRLCGFSDTGPKLIQAVLQGAALVLTFIAMRKLFGRLPAVVGVIVASVYLSAPLIAKFGNVKEQYMIAFMMMGVSCFVLYQLEGKWWLAVLAGAFLSWGPLFKPTGTSAIGAVGLFVILQPVLKHRTLKQTAADMGLLLAGAAAAVGPVYVWIIGWKIQMSVPYSFVWRTVGKMLPAGGAGGQAKASTGYVSRTRKLVSFSEQWPRVLRYYWLLILPVALAVSSIVLRIGKMAYGSVGRSANEIRTRYERFVLLFAVWWILDMAYVWISPRSYEQYYLPLNASGAMLGGYVIAIYRDKASGPVYKGRWIGIGVVALLLMIVMSWHVFFGIETSPHTGIKYPQKRKGYKQKLDEVSRRRRGQEKYTWEHIGEYIRVHSEPTDKIYVWGWWPGIYVKAQRFSSASRAFMMPRAAPAILANAIGQLLDEFEKETPKFIVDSRKRHIPTNRPPYELWPIVPKGFLGFTRNDFLPLDKAVIAAYDRGWSDFLRKNFGDDEADRYSALAPFRNFVMENYRVVRMFGQHVLFQLKSSAVNR